MTNSLAYLLRRVMPVAAAIAFSLTVAGGAIAHEDEDEDGPYHDWHSGPHIGPHSHCHWDWAYGYHCGPHIGPHAEAHHNWYYNSPQYQTPYYGWVPYYSWRRY